MTLDQCRQPQARISWVMRTRKSAADAASAALRRLHRACAAPGGPAARHAGAGRGLRPGRRVVCGRAAGRPDGTVLGIDAAGDILELARTRAAEQGLTSVRFEQTTVGDLALDEPVDAVIGRLILMHLPDPVATLRQLAGMVRPGGFDRVLRVRHDRGAQRARPAAVAWWRGHASTSIFTGMGLDPRSPRRLPALFRQAGAGYPAVGTRCSDWRS